MKIDGRTFLSFKPQGLRHWPKAGKYVLCGDTPISAGIAAFQVDCVSEIAQRRLTANGCQASEDLRIRPL